MTRICPACKSSQSTMAGAKDGFEFVRCKGCGTLFTKEGLPPEEQHDYDDYGYGNKSIPDFIDRRCDELLQPFARYRKLNKFLEIGFGAGTILKAAARSGWRVTGVEVSSAAVKSLSASHPEFELFCGMVEDQGLQEASFDVVAIVEVIEHVIDPAPMVKEAFRVLRPGGIAWITTPNLQSLSWKLLGLDWSMVAPPEHLEIFSLEGARELARLCGFRKSSLQTYGLNPYEILSYYRNGRKPVTVAVRNTSGYEVNESLEANKVGKLVKGITNSVLNAVKWGDDIKLWAEKG